MPKQTGKIQQNFAQKKTVEVMAAAALQGKPGLVTVINALAQFRKDLTSGVLNMAPRDCFKPEKKCSLTRSFAKLLIRNFHVQPTANPPSWADIYMCVCKHIKLWCKANESCTCSPPIGALFGNV